MQAVYYRKAEEVPAEAHHVTFLTGRVVQSVMCLATDNCLTADPGVAN